MASTKKAFTGRHMALVFIGGFGVVIAVNLLMASVAVSCSVSGAARVVMGGPFWMG